MSAPSGPLLSLNFLRLFASTLVIANEKRDYVSRVIYFIILIHTLNLELIASKYDVIIFQT